MGQFQRYQLRSELQGHDEDVRLCMTACLQDTVLALVPSLGHIVYQRLCMTPQITREPAVLQKHVCKMEPAPNATQQSHHLSAQPACCRCVRCARASSAFSLRRGTSL